MECRILHTAAELNLFTLLAKKPLSAGEVADKIGADARATAFLLDAVAAIGLLTKHDQDLPLRKLHFTFIISRLSRLHPSHGASYVPLVESMVPSS